MLVMRSSLATKIAGFIERSSVSQRSGTLLAERDALLCEVAAFQFDNNPVFRSLCQRRQGRFDQGPLGWPAVPTDAFRFKEVSCLPHAERRRVFKTSGTTHGTRGEHHFGSMTLYNLAAKAAAERALGLSQAFKKKFLMLTPSPNLAPDSSLTYMLSQFGGWFGSHTEWAFSERGLDLDAVHRFFGAMGQEPYAILGTSFGMVELLAVMGDHKPDGVHAPTFVMLTGGLKGRVKDISAVALRHAVADAFSMSLGHVVSEYGMTELSSQMYGAGLMHDAASLITDELHWAPPWVRITAVDPTTLLPVPEGETGILRIDDLANLDSVVSIQTADLAYLSGSEFVLQGRDPNAVPRGCSLMIEEILEP